MAKQLVIEVKADTTQAKRALGEVDASINKLDTTTSTAAKSAQQLEQATKKLGDTSSTTTRQIATLGAAALALRTAMNFAGELMRLGDEWVRIADRTGMTTEEVQKLSFIAQQSGNSLDQLTQAASQMQNRLASGDKSAIAAVKTLGLSLEALRAASPYEQLEQIAQAIEKIPDPAARTALAMDLFGRSGAASLPTLISGFKALGDEAPVMADNTVRALDRAGDALAKFQLQMKVGLAEAYNTAGKVFDILLSRIYWWIGQAYALLGRLVDLINKLPGGTKVTGAAGLTSAGLMETARSWAETAKAIEYNANVATTSVRKTSTAIVDVGANTKKVAKESKEWAAYIKADIKAVATEFDYAAEQSAKLDEAWQKIGVAAFRKDIEQLAKDLEIAADASGELDDEWQQLASSGIRQAIRDLDRQIQDLAENRLPSLRESFVDAFASLPQTIIGAISGGGSVVGAVGGLFGGTLGKWASTAASVTNFLGKTLSSLLPGIGAALGSGLDWLMGKIFKREGEETQKARQAYFDQMGMTWQELAAKAHDAGAAAEAAFGQIWKAGKLKDLEAGIKALNAELDKYAKKQQEIADIEAQLASLRAQQEVTWEQMEALAEKYGITLDGLGQKYQQMKTTETAKAILGDYQVLINNGADATAVLQGMADEISVLVQNSQKFGTTIPENMRPLIEQLIANGWLVDANGQKIKDLAGIQWGEPVKTQAEIIAESIQNLINKLDELINGPKGLKTIPNTIPDPFRDWRVPGDEGDTAGGGGRGGDRYHSGGMVRPYVVAHRGWPADTVPILAQTGEGILSRRGMSALGRLNAGGGIGGRAPRELIRVVTVDGRVLAETVIDEMPAVARLYVGARG